MTTSSSRTQRVRAGFLPLATLDPAAPMALGRQLYEWFRRAIAEGQLRPGQRVPSSRSLAREVGVSRITVLSAYEQLQAEGYLQTFRGAGTCIATAIPESLLRRATRAAGVRQSPGGARRLSANARRLLALPQERQLAVQGAFRVSLPALNYFPHRNWSRLVARHARGASIEDLAYGDAMGEPGLRSAIADYLCAVRAVRCDASRIIITAGSQSGLQMAFRALLDPGQAVWVEEPGYPGVHRALALAGHEAVPVAVDAEGLNVKDGMRRRPHARAVYITPSHQYPLGMTLSAGRRIQLLSWAQRSGAWIIEDDYDSEYRFGGRPIASLQGLDSDDRVIYAGTFSKVLFPGLRIGYLVLPEDLVPVLRAVRDASDIFAPVLYQRVLADFIRDGQLARHIRRMRALYAERRTRMIAAIKEHLGRGFEIQSAEAGMHLVVRLPHGLDDRLAAQQAAAAGISCIALSDCCLESPRYGGLILGYGGVEMQQISESMRQLARVVRSTRRRGTAA